jgi:hypothetical protein
VRAISDRAAGSACSGTIPGTHHETGELLQPGIQQRFAQKEQRDGHEQAGVSGGRGQRKKLPACALDECQRQENGPACEAERQPQRHGVGSRANDAEAGSQAVQRAAEQREFHQTYSPGVATRDRTRVIVIGTFLHRFPQA